MASRRNLKKNVNYISDVLAGLCMIERMNAAEENVKAIDTLFLQVINTRQDVISRISHTEAGSVKAFYKKLKEDFNKSNTEVFEKLNELSAK